MFRARLASVVVAASLAASGGCHVFDQHPLFGRGHRDGCCPGPAGFCDPGITAGSGPIIEGPILAPTEPFVPGNGQLPVINQPRLQTIPQSIPMPYTP